MASGGRRGNADRRARRGQRGILKTRRLGYDGKGQVRLTSLDETEARNAIAAIKEAPAILEGLVAFEREVSVIAARDRGGNVAIFDIAENVHGNGILATSTVPAAITPQTAGAARSAAEKLLHALDYVGVLGLEFFVLKDGTLLANEFAPRVHNSGHWTEAACAISQFEQHIRAVAGLPLGETVRHSDCVMENLIGDDIERYRRFSWRRTPCCTFTVKGSASGPQDGPCDPHHAARRISRAGNRADSRPFRPTPR